MYISRSFTNIGTKYLATDKCVHALFYLNLTLKFLVQHRIAWRRDATMSFLTCSVLFQKGARGRGIMQ